MRDPKWGRSQEVYSEDPFLTSSLAIPFLSNWQTGGDSKYLMSGGCLKHWAAYDVEDLPNGTKRDQFDAQLNRRNFWESYVAHFRKALKETSMSLLLNLSWLSILCKKNCQIPNALCVLTTQLMAFPLVQARLCLSMFSENNLDLKDLWFQITMPSRISSQPIIMPKTSLKLLCSASTMGTLVSLQAHRLIQFKTDVTKKVAVLLIFI